MTGNFLLDWATLAVSLANVILLLWLGLTVPLNAERRSWDVWFAGFGLLTGAAFFISHTAILGYGPLFIDNSLNLWWYVGWIPVVTLPFAWYVMTLWYAGYWPNLGSQRRWVILTLGLSLGLIGLLLFASPLPSFSQVIELNLSSSIAVAGIPIIFLAYPIYVVLCIGLALNVLRHAAPSHRAMGDLARQRANPWLVANSILLLIVSLLVAGVIIWIISNARGGVISFDRYSSMAFIVGWVDLVIGALIGLSVILLGQAIVSYAIFAGQTLPRRELQRQWYNAIILAVGYGLVVGWSLAVQLRPIYSLLLTTVIMVVFYALLIWRSYERRGHYIRHLQPVVASQRLYETLLTPPTAPPAVDVAAPFQSLCEDMLQTKVAYLLPLGSLAPLVSPLTHPAGLSPLPALSPETLRQLQIPQTKFIPVEPAQVGGAAWALPLWSERGLIGLLLLGPKQDNDLYVEEELEIARASCERLIDTQASTEIARRLMGLQRQRLTESQLMDRQTRRVLHDDVLPQLHAALISLSAQAETNQPTEVIDLLSGAHQQISDLLHEIPTTLEPTLMRRGLIGALRQVIEGELVNAFDQVEWKISLAGEAAVQALPTLTAEVAFYALREAIRNSARHGRGQQPQRPLHLMITVDCEETLILQVEDNGVGLTATSSPAKNGSGQGLALHSTMLAVVGGTLNIDSVPEQFTRVTLSLPLVREA